MIEGPPGAPSALPPKGAAPADRQSRFRGLCLRGVATIFAACALLLAACVTPPVTGRAEAEVLREWGTPTSRYTLPAGGQRLEYATGPFGRETWMIDLDGAGRVTRSAQVLAEAQFLDFQMRVGQPAGLPRDEVLRTLGRPGEVRGGGRQGGEVWSWRYPNNDCLWFQASVDDDGRATSAAYAPDPMCQTPGDGFP